MLNKRQKLVAVLPFIVVCIIMLYTWIKFAANIYLPTGRHYVALALIIVNAFLYFARFRLAVLLTGVILVLATVNLLCIFAVIQTSWIRIGSVSTPDIQLWSLLILAVWFVLNYPT